MSLGQIVSGLYLTTKLATASPDTVALEPQYLAVGDSTLNNGAKTEIVQPAKADDSKTFHFATALSETSFVDGPASTNGSLIPFQRIRVGNDRLELNFDYYGNKNGVGRNNVSHIKAFLPHNIGVGLYAVGKFNEKDMVWWEAWKTFDLGKTNKIMIDVGQGFGKGHLREDYVMTRFTNKNIFAEIAVYSDVRTLSEGLTSLDKFNEALYTMFGVSTNHIYVGVGKNKDRPVVVTGVNNFKDVGMLHFGFLDFKTKAWTLYSTTAVGDVDQKYFSTTMDNIVLPYFGGPVFEDMHFTNPEIRGDVVLRIKGTGTIGRSEYEVKVGNNNKILPFSVGVNMVSEKGILKAGPMAEITKPFEIKALNLSGTFEAYYDFNQKNFIGYMTARYQFK